MSSLVKWLTRKKKSRDSNVTDEQDRPLAQISTQFKKRKEDNSSDEENPPPANRQISTQLTRKKEYNSSDEEDPPLQQTTPPSTGVSVPPDDTDRSGTMEEDSTSEVSPNKRLWKAAYEGDISGMRSAFNDGAVLDWRNPKAFDRTALHIAAFRGKSEAVALLLEWGSSVHVVDKGGDSPLHGAKDVQVAQMLLRHGASVDIIDKEGNTCLHTSSSTATADTVALFISKGLDVNATNNAGETPMHMAAQNIPHCREVVSLLLKEGARVDTVDNAGRTPMHMAVQNINHCKEVVSLLLKEGARVDTVDNDGVTPLHLLKQDAHKEEKSEDIVDYINDQRQECLLMLKNDFNMDIPDAVKDQTKSTNASPTQESIAINMRVHVQNFKKAVKSKGSLTCYMVQCLPFGPPRSGKSCLHDCLLGRRPPGTPTTTDQPGTGSDSTDALTGTRMIQIKMNCRQGTAKSIVVEDATWNEVMSLDEEIAIYMKSIPAPVTTRTPKPTPPAHSQSTGSIKPSSEVQSTSEQLPPLQTQPARSHTPLDEALIDAITRGVTGGNIDTSKLQALLNESITIFFSDTGGQPEFHEVLPALVAGPTVFMLVFNLLKALDSLYKVEYESSHNTYEVYESSFTLRDVLMKCLSSIISYHNAQVREFKEHTSLECPPPPTSVMAIGTHSDLVKKEKIVEMDEALQQSIAETALERESIFEPYKTGQLVIPVDNYNTKDGSKVRQVFERLIKRGVSPYKVELPVSWLGFQLFLRQKGSSTISLSECREIGKRLTIASEDELKSCLFYLHYKTGTIRYYSSVEELKDTVIIQPSIIFTAVSDFIVSTFTQKNVNPSVQKSFQSLGLLKISEVTSVFENHKAAVELSFPQLAALLRHMNILVPAHDTNYDYFLPCALAHAPKFDPSDLASVINPTKAVDPLYLLFKGGFVPVGVYCGLIGFLCKHSWSIARDRSRKPRLYRDLAVMKFELETCDSINCIIQLKANHIEITIEDCDDEVDLVCPYIKQFVTKSMPDVCTQLNYSPSIWHYGTRCRHRKCLSDQKHVATVTKQNTKGCCTLTTETYSLKKRDLYWFSDGSSVVMPTEKDVVLLPGEDVNMTPSTHCAAYKPHDIVHGTILDASDGPCNSQKQEMSTKQADSVLPIPLPAQSIDVLNAKVAPGVSAKDVFVRQSAKLADALSTDPIRFAGEFAAVNLITPTKVDDLSTRSSLSNLEKATQLVTALRVNLQDVDNNPKLLLTICEVLKKHKSHALDTIVDNILEQLAGGTTTK